MGITDLYLWVVLAGTAGGSADDGSLAAARSVFARADLDGDGRLVLAEVRAAGITDSEPDFRAEDADGDGAWSRDEFLVHFRAARLRAGGRPAADLEAEVARILGLRRARTVDEARARSGPASGRLGARPEAASGADHGLLELDARLERALRDLEDRASGRGAVRADFDRVRGLWNERVTRVRALDGAGARSADPTPRLFRALDVLQAKARAGSVPRAAFADLRAAWAERPRRAADPAVGSIEDRFGRAVDELETRALARTARAEDWSRVSDLAPEQARRLAQVTSAEPPAPDDPRVAREAAELRAALEALERRAAERPLERADFAPFRTRFVAVRTARPPPAPSERDRPR